MVTADSYRDEQGRVVMSADFRIAMVEWLEYHRLNGVERMIVFDNTVGVTVAHLYNHFFDQGEAQTVHLSAYEVLKPYIDSGFVIYHHWPLQHCQARLSGNVKTVGPGRRSSQYIQESVCLRRYGPTTKWLGVMDRDEFFMSARKDQRAVDLLRALETKRPDADAFTFHPVHMARCTRDSEINFSPMLRHVTRVPRGPPQFKPGIFKVKQIFRPDRVWYHHVHYSKERFWPDEVDPRTLRRYGNGLKVIRSIDQPLSVHTDNNTTAVFLHLKRSFRISPAAHSPEHLTSFMGSCPRPFPLLTNWLKIMNETLPELYHQNRKDPSLKLELESICQREKECMREGGIEYAEKLGRVGFPPYFTSLRWTSLDSLDESGASYSIPFNLRCEKDDAYALPQIGD
uniref:Glycosyltransferase family 92 protein n=1 Tax=Pinguiococcus pyrenoidosus TaxID=172671 RepID=A0A7R9UGU9_9STRA